MKKLIKIVTLLLLFCSIFSCNKKVEEKKVEEKKVVENVEKKTEDEKLYTNISIERLIERFIKNSKKNKIEINEFTKFDYEGKNFYYSKILSKDDSTYTIEYTGVNAVGLFVKINMITGADLGLIENIVINLIEISDTNITTEEAKKLYTELLANMKEKELSNAIMYGNGLSYGIQIEKNNGAFVFYIQ